MALTKDEPRRFETSTFTAAIAATAIYQGACVGTVRASGQAAGGAFASATHRFAGFATTGAAIGERVTIDAKGRVILAVAGTSAASVNAVVYASDDNSFNVAGTGIAIGRISWVQDDGKCVVDFDAGNNDAMLQDAAGNIIANIVPRHDTLSSLLLVADAGEGEIASVSDKDALVVYKGGVGEVYWKSELVAESLVLGGMNVTTGALVHFDLTNKTTFGFFDNVGNVNLTDNTLDATDGAQFTHIEISAAVAFPAGDGTKRRAEIQYDVTGGGVWVNVLSLQSVAGAESIVPNISGEVITVQVQGFSAYVASGANLYGKRFRLAVGHDATGTLNGVVGYIRQRAYRRT